MKTFFQRLKGLLKPNNTYNGWTYDYKNMSKSVQAVTITTPDKQVLRPVLLPRPGYDWFTNG